jgi:DNA (cytosine-5)-methyltransferase 1
MLTVTDIFAGAGGSSTGMIVNPDVQVRVAANHWQEAVDVHNANHPTTEHMCVDLHLEDPRNFPKTDVLWASPECTKWSIANNRARALSAEMGGDPTLFDDVPEELISEGEDEATRSRLLMFDVLRFIEHHRYRLVFVENVADIAMQAKYRPAWEAWKRGARKLGYQFRVISLNSMHAQTRGLPAPQSRDRIYIAMWPEREPAPDFERILRPQAWCPRCEQTVESRQAWKNGRTVGRYRAQYVYACSHCGHQVEPGWLPAAAAIDWSLPGTRIGDRSKPLADKTRARIAAGIARYWRPFILDRRGEYRLRSLGDALSTITANETTKALAVPVEGRDNVFARPLHGPFRSQTSRLQDALVVAGGAPEATHCECLREDPPGPTHSRYCSMYEPWPQPFIAELRGGSSDARSVDDPLCTVTASGNHHALVAPYYGTAEYARPSSDPLGTLTTRDRYALITRHYGIPGGDPARHTTPSDEVLRTLTGNGGNMSLLMRNNTGGAEMVTPVYEPMRTLTGAGHQSVLTPGDLAAAQAEVDDCLFRMLEPHEVAAGMAFPTTYIWHGNRRVRVRLMGNAVTPPSARDLMWAGAEYLGAAA